MADYKSRIDRPVIVSQQISAGGAFDATLPADSPTLTDDVYLHAAAAAGGLFDPGDSRYAFDTAEPLRVTRVLISFGGQTAWSLSLVDNDGAETVLYEGTTEGEFHISAPSVCEMNRGEQLALRTTGATGIMKASLTFTPAYLHM